MMRMSLMMMRKWMKRKKYHKPSLKTYQRFQKTRSNLRMYRTFQYNKSQTHFLKHNLLLLLQTSNLRIKTQTQMRNRKITNLKYHQLNLKKSQFVHSLRNQRIKMISETMMKKLMMTMGMKMRKKSSQSLKFYFRLLTLNLHSLKLCFRLCLVP
jgi:hypothetical protein